MEIDFDSYFPFTIVLNKGNEFPYQLVKLFEVIYNARLYFKGLGQLGDELVIKDLQNTLVGCLGSEKEKVAEIQDFHSHSLVMRNTRSEIDRLKEYVESNGLNVYQV